MSECTHTSLVCGGGSLWKCASCGYVVPTIAFTAVPSDELALLRASLTAAESALDEERKQREVAEARSSAADERCDLHFKTIDRVAAERDDERKRREEAESLLEDWKAHAPHPSVLDDLAAARARAEAAEARANNLDNRLHDARYRADRAVFEVTDQRTRAEAAEATMKRIWRILFDSLRWRERDMTVRDRVFADRLNACSEDRDLTMVGRAFTLETSFESFCVREAAKAAASKARFLEMCRRNHLSRVVAVEFVKRGVSNKAFLACGHTRRLSGGDRLYASVGAHIKCNTCAGKISSKRRS